MPVPRTVYDDVEYASLDSIQGQDPDLSIEEEYISVESLQQGSTSDDDSEEVLQAAEETDDDSEEVLEATDESDDESDDDSEEVLQADQSDLINTMLQYIRLEGKVRNATINKINAMDKKMKSLVINANNRDAKLRSDNRRLRNIIIALGSTLLAVLVAICAIAIRT